MTRRRGRGLLTRAIETVVVVSHLYARPTDPTPPTVADGYEVRPANEADLARISTDLGDELTARKAGLIRERAGRTDHTVFVAVTDAGEVAGFGHTEHGRVADAHLRLDLGEAPGVAHLFDDYVASRHRGHRLQGSILTARVAEAAARGAHTATILVEASNHASRASVTRAGFTRLLTTITLKTPWWRGTWPLARHSRQRLTAD